MIHYDAWCGCQSLGKAMFYLLFFMCQPIEYKGLLKRCTPMCPVLSTHFNNINVEMLNRIAYNNYEILRMCPKQYFHVSVRVVIKLDNQ